MSGLELLPRSAWNARPRRSHPGILEADEVIGLAFHWPGSQTSRPLSRDAVPRALRSWQDFHMDGNGWSDIAYQVAVDQWGRGWELRGLAVRSAANGGTWVNSTHGAVLLVLVQGEEPSAAMLETARLVVAEHRRLFGGSTELVGHGAIRPGGGTECPGPQVRAALERGEFNPTREDEFMAEPADVWDVTVPEYDENSKADQRRARVLLAQAHNRAGDARELAAKNAKRLDAIEEQLEAIAAAVGAGGRR